MEDRLLTIDEVEKYLNIPKSTIYKLSQKGKLPSCKIGKQLRFRKSSLDKWLTEKEEGILTQPHYPPTEIQTVTNRQSRYVLLIDDDKLVLKALARLLKINGFDVELAESGEEALKKVQNLSFNLIITDIKMPGMDGIETIKRIREFYGSSNRPAIPEIIITGYADSQAQQDAESLGITDYLYKPFAISEFIKIAKKKLEFGLDLN